MLEKISLLLTIIGALVFIVTVITQVLKDIPGIKQIPTSILVTILSIVFSVVTVVAYSQYVGIYITWYFIVASIVVGFIVAFISMYGWDKLNDVWSRSKFKTK